MSADESAKPPGIRQIVRLRELLLKWQSMALGPKDADLAPPPQPMPAPSAIPPMVALRLRSMASSASCDSDDEGCRSPEAAAADVPRGCCPVYVGREQRRFVIPTSYLGQPVFRLLLEKAEEEFGFEQGGALAIPCDTETFKYILQCMARHERGLIDDDGNPTGLEESPEMS